MPSGPSAEIAAWWAVLELCFPSHRTCGAATFAPAGPETFGSDWNAWVELCYRPVLLPAVFAAHAAAADGSSAALRAAENALALALAEAPRAASLAAGRRVLFGCAPPQGSRFLERWCAESDRTTGHMAAVFAVRGQIFHLPCVQIAAALALAECLLGAASVGHVLEESEVASLMAEAVSPGVQGGMSRWAVL